MRRLRHYAQPTYPVDIDWTHPVWRLSASVASRNLFTFFAHVGLIDLFCDAISDSRELSATGVPLSAHAANGYPLLSFEISGSGNYIDVGRHISAFTVGSYVVGFQYGTGTQRIFTNNNQTDAYRGPWVDVSSTAFSMSYGSGVALGPTARRTVSSSGFTFESGKHYNVGGCIRGATTGQVFVNGFRTAMSSSGTGGVVAEGIGNALVGRFNPGGPFYSDFRLTHLIIWNGDIGDELLRDLSINPWQLLKPQRRFWTFAAAAGQTLTAAHGTYALSGQAVALKRAVKLAAAQGSYALSGQAALLVQARKIAAAQGSYSLTGQSASLIHGLKLVAAQGAYTLTGQAVLLPRGYRITAAQGSYNLAGQAATLTKSSGATLLANQGSYTLAGQAVAFRRAYTLTAAQGAYALAGQAAALHYGRTLVAGQGSYALTGQAVNLTAQKLLTAAHGIYVLAGQAVTLTSSVQATPPAALFTPAARGMFVPGARATFTPKAPSGE